MKVSILEKLNEAKKILIDLDNKEFNKIKKNPDYIQCKECNRNKNNFNFIFDRRLNGERQNLKLSFNKNSDKNIIYQEFRDKLKEKYNYGNLIFKYPE